MFTPKLPEEYYGKLFYKSSGTLCLDNAVLWFVKDKRGGWSELQLKLGNNDLEMRVAKVPADRSGLQELVGDLVQSCTSQGARDLGPLDKPLTFTEQVSVLTEKGLIGSKTPAVPTPPPPPTVSPEEQELLVAHRNGVKEFIRQELYEQVSEPEGGPGDLAGDGPGVVHIDTPEDQRTTDVLALELNSAKEQIKKLEQKLVASHARNLQLENHAATDHGTLLEQMKISLKETLKEENEKNKLELLSKVHTEVNAALDKNSDQILNGFDALATAAGLAEVIENVAILTDRTSDLILSTTRMGNDVSLVPSMSSRLDECARSLAMATSQLANQKTLIVDALKDKVPPEVMELTTPLKTGSKYPLTPLSGPRDYQSPSSSRSAGHTTTYKPRATRLDSPGRDRDRGVEHRRRSRSRSPSSCLDPKHKMHKCPHITQRCTLCKENGVEDSFAYGHLRKIHSETDRRRRQHILRYLPPVCFPSW